MANPKITINQVDVGTGPNELVALDQFGRLPLGTTVAFTTSGSFVVPDGVTQIYVSGCGGGQGGQGGGDGGSCRAGTTPPQGGSSIVTASNESLTIRGGYSIMSYTGTYGGYNTITPWTGTKAYKTLQGKNAAIPDGMIHYNLGEDRSGTVGNPERGGHGGNGLFGAGGTGRIIGFYKTAEGGFNYGGGGAGGEGQDSLAGNGGCSAFSILQIPLSVVPGETVSITVGLGSNGTTGCRGTGGKGGDGIIIIQY